MDILVHAHAVVTRLSFPFPREPGGRLRLGCILINCLIVFKIYTGVLIGTLPTEQHQVSGKFYIVDSKTLFFEDFNYDGAGPGRKKI